MAITTGLVNLIKQTAADAICPSGSTLKIALLISGSYDQTYASAYSAGMGGDEHGTANGYTQGGQTLGTRTVGPTANQGWVDYADAVWTATGALTAIGAVIYDSTNANRIVGFIDFGGTKTATDASFTVQIPDTGNGLVRIS